MTMQSQRDDCMEMKIQTVLNVETLNLLQKMPQDIFRQVLKENAIEKPTEKTFNNLAYYFASIIDPKASESLPWPLYDSKTVKKFRNDLSVFICNHSSQGFLTPVMSSYMVRPNCYKVTVLIYEMSLLAIQKLLESKMKTCSVEKLYNEITEIYKSNKNNDYIKEKKNVLSQFSNYLDKRNCTEKMAGNIREKISKIESQLALVNADKYLNDLVDEFISKHKLDTATKEDISKIKDIKKPAPFFDRWVTEVDRKMDEMDSKWNEKMTPFIQICQESKQCTELLIARHTGEAERDTHMIEYNHKTDEICTKELEDQVNWEQKCVLRSIVIDEKLNFPNLIRGFLIAISFIFKGVKTGNEIYQFNEYLEGGKKSYGGLVQDMRDLLRRVHDAKCQLKPRAVVSANRCSELFWLPDLSDLMCAKVCPALCDTFTPINISKHQFNLCRQMSQQTFDRPQLFTPLQAPKMDFKYLTSCRAKPNLNATQSFHNMSIISKTDKSNETIAGYSTGCTKEQLLRLLSTKKSSCKKSKHGEMRMNIKKGGLFNDSILPNESHLVRSYSSPNLYENREVRKRQSGRRKLSVMHESGSPLLDVSGIIALNKDSSCESRNQSPQIDLPTIHLVTDTPKTDTKFHQSLKDFNLDQNKEFSVEKIPDLEVVTPQNNPKPTNKKTSLEKIINRYKKLRETVHPEHEEVEKSNDYLTITEEKENVFMANRTRSLDLSDSLRPSCSVNSFEDLQVPGRNVRESLGTVLGVDQTFLDQYDLIV